MAIRSDEHTAGCLLYRDGAKYYVEITIRNQSGHDLTIGDGLIGIEQDGRELEPIDTDVAVAQLDTNTRKTFVLVAFGDRTPSYRYLRTHEKPGPVTVLVRVANDELKFEFAQ